MDFLVEGSASNGSSPIASSTARGNPELSGENIISASISLRPQLRRATTMLIPDKPLAPPPSFVASLKEIIFSSWHNVLFVCIPISWALHFALPDSLSCKDTLIFVFSFFAIIPLTKLLGFATHELSLRAGRTLAGLLNGTLGNTIELIVAIVALVKCEPRIVQASLVGSVLRNLLFVLGMCFFSGGLKYFQQGFNVIASQLNASLLMLGAIAFLLPVAFHISADSLTDAQKGHNILALSHWFAVILLLIYAGYLFFRQHSHAFFYEDQGLHSIRTTAYTSPKFRIPRLNRRRHIRFEEPVHSPIEEEDTPKLNLYITIGLLTAVTVVVAVTANWLVDSINGLTSSGDISKEFVAIFLLPIIGNASHFQHTTNLLKFGMHRQKQSRHFNDIEAIPRKPPSSVGTESMERNQTLPLHTWSEEPVCSPIEEEKESPQSILYMVIGLLAAVAGVVAILLVHSIHGWTSSDDISKIIISIILLPMIGNAASSSVAVNFALKDKLNLSLQVAVGSSIHIMLFVIPFIVILSWILGKPLTLLFDPYESIAIFLAVLIVNYVVQDGKSSWLEGLILIGFYVILGVMSWIYPGSDLSGLLGSCT